MKSGARSRGDAPPIAVGVYDEPELRRTLEEIGFRVAAATWNRSEHPELRYLDLRDFGLNLFLEATRP